MRTLRPLLAVAAMCTATLALAVAPAPGATTAGKRCEDVLYRLDNGTVYARTYYLAAYRTSCRTARRVASFWLRNAEGNANIDSLRPYGFTCTGTDTRNGHGMSCRKGRQEVRWLGQPPKARSASARCGNNKDGEPIYFNLVARGVSCRFARELAVSYASRAECYRHGCRVSGYRCSRKRTGYESYTADCRRGQAKRITFGYGA
ncbi:MAG: hypothetical protein ACSLFR_16885 [Solirubrobacteraceae bacterium]